MPPSKLFLNKSLRFQRLHGFDYLQVWNVFQFRMFRCMEVFFCDHNTFLEEGLVYSDAVFLRHQHSKKNFQTVIKHLADVKVMFLCDIFWNFFRK